MSSAKHIYSIADNHAQTVQVCIDRLHQLHANQQLKRLAERLQKLATQAASANPGSHARTNKGKATPRRQWERPEPSVRTDYRTRPAAVSTSCQFGFDRRTTRDFDSSDQPADRTGSSSQWPLS